MPVEVGIGPAIKKREKTFPFIVVIPRAEGCGWGADTANAKRAWRCSTRSMKEYKVDPKRQYLTGLSMGGMGTWSIADGAPGPLGGHRARSAAAATPKTRREDQGHPVLGLPRRRGHGGERRPARAT